MLQIFFEYLDILCILQTSHVKMATSASIIVISWIIVMVLVIILTPPNIARQRMITNIRPSLYQSLATQ
jgi:hypothetical protein